MDFVLEETIQQARNEFENILKDILDSSGDQQICGIEKGILQKMLLLGSHLLKIYVQSICLKFTSKFHIDKNGVKTPFHSFKPKQYRSVFGSITIVRPYYWKKSTGGISSVDCVLNLPEGSYSYLLQEWGSCLSVTEPYDKAASFLTKVLGQCFWGSTLEDISRKGSVHVKQFYESRCSSSGNEPKGELLVISADCKGVTMRKDQFEEKKTRPRHHYRRMRKVGERMKEEAPQVILKHPEKKKSKYRRCKEGKKKMATVTAIYTIDRQRRTPEDVLSRGSNKLSSQNKTPPPRPQNKIIYGTLEGKDEAFKHLKAEETRNKESHKKQVALVDGEAKLNELIAKNFPSCEIIRDLFHVTEYLWAGAHVLYREDSKEAQDMVSRYLEMLLRGDLSMLIAEFYKILDQHESEIKQKELKKIIKYLENGKECMQYNRYLAEGYPIASGVIEGTCKNLINDRLEHSGMHWSINGSDSIIKMRSLQINNFFEDYWMFHTKYERERLYGNRLTEMQNERLVA